MNIGDTVTDSNYGIDKKIITYQQFQDLVKDTIDAPIAFNNYTDNENTIYTFKSYKYKGLYFDGEWSVYSITTKCLNDAEELKDAISQLINSEVAECLRNGGKNDRKMRL